MKSCFQISCLFMTLIFYKFRILREIIPIIFIFQITKIVIVFVDMEGENEDRTESSYSTSTVYKKGLFRCKL